MKKPEVGERLSTPTANINGKEIELKEGKFEIL